MRLTLICLLLSVSCFAQVFGEEVIGPITYLPVKTPGKLSVFIKTKSPDATVFTVIVEVMDSAGNVESMIKFAAASQCNWVCGVKSKLARPTPKMPCEIPAKVTFKLPGLEALSIMVSENRLSYPGIALPIR